MTGLGASWLLARLAWKRVLRGRALWFTVLLLGAPTLVAVLGPQEPGRWRIPVNVLTLVLAVAVPMHLATAVSDEIEDNTLSYLWSRPVPRWSLLAGKLIAAIPPLAVLFALGGLGAFLGIYGGAAGDHAHVYGRLVGGLSVGVVAVGMLSVGLGAVIPRFSLATVVAYMLLFDTAIGKIPFAINQLSITHHVRVIAGVPEKLERYAAAIGVYDTGSIAESVAWALALGLVWLGVALWRVAVAELTAQK